MSAMPLSSHSGQNPSDDDDEDKPDTSVENETEDESAPRSSEKSDDVGSVSTSTSKLLSGSAPPSPLPFEQDGNKWPNLRIASLLLWSQYHDYDIITIHGIRDDSRTAWQTPDGVWWITEQLFSTLSARQIAFSYEIDESADVFTPNGIKRKANSLLDQYISNRDALPSTEVDRPIIWICHDVGGTIAKQALIQATLEPVRYARIAHLTTAIVFLGCPHRAHSISELEDQLHDLLILPGPGIKSGIVQKVKDIAAQTATVNTQFLETKLTSRAMIMNIFSEQIREPEEPAKDDDETSEGSGVSENAIKASGDAAGEVDNDQRQATETAGEDTMVLSEPKDENLEFKPRANIDEAVKPENLRAQDSFTVELEPPRPKSNVPDEAEAQSEKVPVPEKNGPAPLITPFRRYTVLMGHPFETFGRSRVDVNHLDLVKSGDPWTSFTDFFNKTAYPIEVNYRIIQNQINLLSLVPPRRTTDLHFNAQDPRNPIIAWIYKQKAFGEFNVPVETKLLHLHVNEPNSPRIGQLSQKLYIDYDLEYGNQANLPEQSVLFFQFDKRDSRYNNLRSMLITFLNDIIWHFWKERADQVTHVLNFFASYRCSSLEDLYYAFNYLRDFAGIEQLTFFISCFDQCHDEERKWFLKQVSKKQGFTCMISKMIISTSGPDKAIMDELLSTPTIDISKSRAYKKDEIATKELELHQLKRSYVRAITERRIFGLYFAPPLMELQSMCEEHPYLGQMIFPWLSSYKRGASRGEIDKILEELHPITPQNVANVFIGVLEPQSQARAKAVYHWVKHAAEPLTPDILAQAVALSTSDAEIWIADISTEDFCREIERVFSGMIIVDGRDVKFSHDVFYDLPDFSTEHSPEIDVPNIHYQIAEVCLRYLKSNAASEKLPALSVGQYSGSLDATPLMLPRSDFSEYAVRFWPMHYRLSNSKALEELAMNLFEDREIRNRWAEAHYVLSNPFTRIHRSYFTALPYMSMIGLEGLVLKQLGIEKDAPSFNQSCWLAITEAARYGHKDIVAMLLDYAQEDQEGLRDAVSWAASYGKGGALDVLVNKAREMVDFKWPEYMLSRAASAGLVTLLSALHASGHNMNEKDASNDMPAIVLAARCGQKEAVDLLIEYKADLTMQDDAGDPPLFQAVKRGDPDIISSFLNAGADIHQRDDRGGTVVNSAVDFGRSKALEMLIKAGADFNSGEEKDESKELGLRVPIVHAAEFGYKECVRLLLENNADARAESPHGSALYLASRNYVEICRLLLEKGAEPNQCYKDRDMLLLRAIASKKIKMVELLIDKGAIVDSVDTSGPYCNTPLARAIEERSRDIFDLLLEKGAEVNFVGDGSWSPLFTAAYQGEFEMAKILIEKGADVHWKRSDDWTPLHAAYDRPNIIELLLQHGADINSLSEDGTVTMLASKWGCIESLKFLLAQRPKPNLELAIDKGSDHVDFNCTALLIACKQGKPACVRLLLEAGANMNYKMNDGSYALELCLDKSGTDSEETLKVLLEYKPDLRQKDDNGDTVLHSIRTDTPLSVVSILVESGAPFDAVNKDGFTPLAIAIDTGNVEVAKYLISRGANVTVLSGKFGSLLHLACKRNSIELFKLLIEKNADINAVDLDFSESLLYTALGHKDDSESRDNLVRYLVEDAKVSINAQGGTLGYPIILAAYKGRASIVRYLIRHGADVNSADDLGRRAIHVAAAVASSFVISVLIKAGAELTAKDKYGRTPLHFSAMGQTASTLLDSLPKDFDVNQPDHDGWTPLMWGCRFPHNNLYELGKLIQDHGADIWARSRDNNWSPLKIANFHDFQQYEKDQLKPAEDQRTRIKPNGEREKWDDSLHESRPGDSKQPSRCSSCFATIYGIEWICNDCREVSICFKCYNDRLTMHNNTHSFQELGPLYKPEGTDKPRSSSAASGGGREETPEIENEEDEERKVGKDEQEEEDDEDEEDEEENSDE